MSDVETLDVEDPRIQNRLEEVKDEIKKEIRKEFRVKEGIENMLKVYYNLNIFWYVLYRVGHKFGNNFFN